MDRIKGNFLTQANRDFPLDCETLDYLQGLAELAAVAGNIGGDRVVLWGCEATDDGAHRESGYVFLRTRSCPEGEILAWEGGPTGGGMYVKQEDISVTANNTDYLKAYTRRSLAPGIGEENYAWDDFTDIKTIKDLMIENEKLREEVAGLSRRPLGIVEMWAGREVPEGYVLCNGQELRISEYGELYKAIGSIFNTGPNASGGKFMTQEGFFRVPDLRGRFVVGLHDSDADYKSCGQCGGKKSVALSEREMPRHSHEVKDYYYPEKFGEENSDIVETNQKLGSKSSDYDNVYLHYYKHSSDTAGAGAAHENRPPYYVLAYIMRAK